MNFRLLPLLATAAVILPPSDVSADPRRLLGRALEKWGDEVDRWSFVQRVSEYRGESVAEKRVERFDPSRPDCERWELLSIDGRPPTASERRAFDARKNRKRRNRFESPVQYVDFDRVSIARETAEVVVLDVPLRADRSFFVPFELVLARVEVDKATESVRRIEVGLREEMSIAFGLIRVTGLEMVFEWEVADDAVDIPEAIERPAPPDGRAMATISRFGRRSEISWSDFSRVDS